MCENKNWQYVCDRGYQKISVFISSVGYDEIYDHDSRVDIYNDCPTRHFFNLDKGNLKKLVLQLNLVHA